MMEDRDIPMKPINVKKWREKGDETISDAECPQCGEPFPDIGGVAEAYGEVEKYPYCPWCGQKIDWDI